jgi:hypothetical protein
VHRQIALDQRLDLLVAQLAAAGPAPEEDPQRLAPRRPVDPREGQRPGVHLDQHLHHQRRGLLLDGQLAHQRRRHPRQLVGRKRQLPRGQPLEEIAALSLDAPFHLPEQIEQPVQLIGLVAHLARAGLAPGHPRRLGQPRGRLEPPLDHRVAPALALIHQRLHRLGAHRRQQLPGLIARQKTLLGQAQQRAQRRRRHHPARPLAAEPRQRRLAARLVGQQREAHRRGALRHPLAQRLEPHPRLGVEGHVHPALRLALGQPLEEDQRRLGHLAVGVAQRPLGHADRLEPGAPEQATQHLGPVLSSIEQALQEPQKRGLRPDLRLLAGELGHQLGHLGRRRPTLLERTENPEIIHGENLARSALSPQNRSAAGGEPAALLLHRIATLLSNGRPRPLPDRTTGDRRRTEWCAFISFVCGKPPSISRKDAASLPVQRGLVVVK